MTEPPRTPSASQQLVDEFADSAIVEQRVAREKRIAAAPAPVDRQRSVRVALAIAVPILIAVLVVTLAWEPLVALFEPSPSPEVARLQAQETLDALVVRIDSFHKDYSHLPATLVEVGVPPSGRWSYLPSGNTQYTVSGMLFGQAVSFDSARIAPKPAGERP
jgi:hypothetical protein